MARSRLLASVADADADLLLVLAPAGFGKTTFVSQWAATTGRPVAWATVREADGDPVILISTLLAALETCGMSVELPTGQLTSDEPVFSRRVLPEFQVAIEQLGGPVTVVVDDVHTMPHQQAAEVLAALADSLQATGSRLALVGRTRPDLPVALWRSQARLREIGKEDLAFDLDEARAFVDLLREPQQVPDEAVGRILSSTAGWPVAVYLQAMAHDRDDRVPAGTSLALTDYLDDVVLGAADDRLLRFLRRTSVLATMSAASCDRVLDLTDSHQLLRQAASATLLVNRLEGEGGFYRLHPLLRERLDQQLQQTEPDVARRLHARAAMWHDENGFVDEAIGHAARSGDRHLIGTVIWKHTPAALIAGRHGTVRGWLARVDEETVATTPSLATAAAWASVLGADGANALRWAEAAAKALGADWRQHLDRSSVEAALALLLAFPGTPTFEAAAGLAGASFQALPATHPLRPLARFMQGAYLALGGRMAEGRAHVEESRDLVRSSHHGTTWAGTSTALAVFDIQKGSWSSAEEEIAEARQVWATYDLDTHITTAWTLSVSAFLHARAGAASAAVRDLRQVEAMIAGVAPVLPAVQLVVHSFVGRAYAELHDHGAAAAAVRRSHDVLERLPPSAFLAAVVASADEALARSDLLSRLTPAEQRLWPYLMRRSTLRQIAAELHLSPETVKSQLSSIYRKLGVGSRRELQDLADTLGPVV